MMGDPPSAGALNWSVALPLPPLTLVITGAAGGVGDAAGVTAFDDTDGGPVPTLLVALAVKV